MWTLRPPKQKDLVKYFVPGYASIHRRSRGTPVVFVICTECVEILVGDKRPVISLLVSWDIWKILQDFGYYTLVGFETFWNLCRILNRMPWLVLGF